MPLQHDCPCVVIDREVSPIMILAAIAPAASIVGKGFATDCPCNTDCPCVAIDREAAPIKNASISFLKSLLESLLGRACPTNLFCLNLQLRMG